MIRVVLAVVLASALLAASLPIAERTERDRNAAVALEELDRVATAAHSLYEENDPATEGARAMLEVAVPEPSVSSGGRLVLENDRFAWVPERGPTRTVRVDVPVSTSGIVVTDVVSIRLTLLEIAGNAVVRIELANVHTRRRNQTTRALDPSIRRPGMSMRADVRR